MSEEGELLPLAERAQQYRRKAEEAFENANAVSNPEIRRSLLMLAHGWRALAIQVEETQSARK